MLIVQNELKYLRVRAKKHEIMVAYGEPRENPMSITLLNITTLTLELVNVR